MNVQGWDLTGSMRRKTMWRGMYELMHNILAVDQPVKYVCLLQCFAFEKLNAFFFLPVNGSY